MIKDDFDEYLEKQLQNPEFKEEWERGQFEHQLKCALIEARIKRNLSKKDLAEKIGTNQSNISKFESGHYSPSLDFLRKLANALGKEIKISLV